MEDNNLNFNKDFLEERKINKKRCLVIKEYLSNSFEYCPKCSCVNDNSIIKKVRINLMRTFLLFFLT